MNGYARRLGFTQGQGEIAYQYEFSVMCCDRSDIIFENDLG